MSWEKSFVHTRTGKIGPELRSLYQLCDAEERSFSPEFFERYGAGRGTGGLTPFAGLRQGPAVFAQTPVAANVDLEGSLGRTLRTALADHRGEVAVAVSGGIDCWVLGALLKSLGYRVRGWCLQSDVNGYCEYPQAAQMASTLGISCEPIRVTAEDFVQAIPDFLDAAEMPVYNLHPVSKILLALALARRGIDVVVGGDGADQVMLWDWDCDLLPLTLSCFAHAGVRLLAPFLEIRTAQPDPLKMPVRKLAREFGIPDVPKRPTLFPAVSFKQGSCLEYTAVLLRERMEESQPCAALPESCVRMA